VQRVVVAAERRGPLQDREQPRVGVAEHQRSPAEHEVKVAAAVDVEQLGAGAALDEELEAGRVTGRVGRPAGEHGSGAPDQLGMHGRARRAGGRIGGPGKVVGAHARSY
jgi:hypothetical protein